MNRFFLFYILPIACCLFIFSCTTPGNIRNQNIAYLYQPDKLHFKPEFKVWNYSDDSSRLYVRINPKEFLFTRNEENFTANFSVAYRLIESYENPIVIDSSRKSFATRKNENSSANVKSQTRIKMLPMFFISMLTGRAIKAETLFLS